MKLGGRMQIMGLMLGMMSMSAGGGYMPNENRRMNSGESEKERKERFKEYQNKKNKLNGLKEFVYGNNSVWAINQKNADKKAKKLNFI